MAANREPNGLSHRQWEFADRMDCRLVTPCANGSVCVYRVLPDETIRWIIGTDGSVLDWAIFHTSA